MFAWLQNFFDHVTWVPLLFLCVQALIVYAGIEVAVRYFRWYLKTPRDGSLLRSLLLGIAVTMVAVVSDRLSWMLENITNFEAVDRLINLLPLEYTRLLIIRSWLFIGIVIHLVPLWRVLYEDRAWAILLKIVGRSLLAIAAYFFVLYLRGALWCLITDYPC